MADQYWGDVVALLHFDRILGTGDSTLIDFSYYAKTRYITNLGLLVTVPKFGGRSLFCNNGTGFNIATNSDAAKWISGTEDFTIEFWLKTTDSSCVVVDYYGVGKGFQILVDSTGVIVVKGDGGSGLATDTLVFGATSVNTNSFVNIALVRIGNVLSLYIDGILDATGAFTESIVVPPYFTMGYQKETVDSGLNLTGYIDELRITKGVGRYSSNYAVEISIFTPGEYVDLYHQYSVLSLKGASSLSENALSGLTYPIPDSSYFRASLITPYTYTYFASSSFKGGYSYFEGRTSTSLTSFEPMYTSLHNEYSLGANDFTIEFAISTNGTTYGRKSLTQNGMLIMLSNGNTDNLKLYLKANTNPSIVECVISGTSSGTLTSTATVSNNTWYHVALVRSAGSLTLYIGGISQGSISDSNVYLQRQLVLFAEGVNTNGIDSLFEFFNIYKYAKYTSNYIVYDTIYPDDSPNVGIYSATSITNETLSSLNFERSMYIDPIYADCVNISVTREVGDFNKAYCNIPFWKWSVGESLENVKYGIISGTTKKNGVNEGNIVVFLYYRPTGELILKTHSDETGYFVFQDLALDISSSDYLVVAIIDDAYNAVTSDKITPI